MTLTEELMLHQQGQTVGGKFGSWHSDGERRCADLVKCVIEPRYAPAVERIAELEAAIRKWFGECGDCDGTGLVAFNYWDHERQISPSDRYPCHACADIRALLPTERTA